MATPSPLPAATTPSQATPTPTVRLYLSSISSTLSRSFSNSRPLSELFDRSAFARPDSLSDAISRIRKNISYFRVNYLLFLSSILAFTLLTHPFSLLLLLSLLAAWLFLYLLRPSDPPLVIFGRTFSERETLAGLVLLSVIAVFMTSVGSILISAFMTGALLVAAHGAFRMPEDLFLDDVEQGTGAGSGLLSFLGNAAVVAGAPAVAARG